MGSSEAVTRGIRVRVRVEYAPEQSNPPYRWFFLYTITISNESRETVQLVTRHWLITDEPSGRIEEVRGPGVVGQQPVLEPGQSFEYTSGCPLSSPSGWMEGTYQMMTADGDQFDATIARFTLQAPYTIH